MGELKQTQASVDSLADGILAKDTRVLSKAITLVESRLDSDRETAIMLLDHLLPYTGQSIRIGITGIPGVGKSSLIEQFGLYLTSQGEKVAVIAIDPSSQKTKGSILGDKTRMHELSNHPDAFIRPSAAGSSQGGVTDRTREIILLCEATGFDTIIIETVGVGQSETRVREVVDFFLLLALAGAGDELQGMKRGIMEMADLIAITKADGDNLKPAQQACLQYEAALQLFPPTESGWEPKAVTCSAQNKEGIENLWQIIEQYRRHSRDSGFFDKVRQAQLIQWMHHEIEQKLKELLINDPVYEKVSEFEKQITAGVITPVRAAQQLITGLNLRKK